MQPGKKEPTWLLEHQSNCYSQGGEDGVIGAVLGLLPQTDHWCAELGASDGISNSNTRLLLKTKDYKGVLMEANARKFRALEQDYAGNERAILLHRTVGFSGADRLDQVLASTSIPKDFDLLVLDIDGNDYHVWAALSDYQPKVVCIEFNPSIPTEVRFVQPADPRVSHGSSLLSLVELSRTKEYELVAVLSCNAIFVRREFYPLFEIPDNRPEVLRTDTQWVTHLFVGYDGTVLLDGYRRLPWHGLELNSSRVQHLPRILRQFPGEYTLFKWLLYLSLAFTRSPRWAWGELKRFLAARRKRRKTDAN